MGCRSLFGVIGLAAITGFASAPSSVQPLPPLSGPGFAVEAATSRGAERIDRLVNLLHSRLSLAEDVAKAKFNSVAAIDDPKRESVVLAAAVDQARHGGISADDARELFGAQIEASKMAQRAFLKRWIGHPKFSRVANLARDMRPKLDALTTSIIAALKSTKGELSSPVGRRALRAAIRRHLFTGREASVYRAAWATAVAPLTKIAGSKLP